MIDFKATEEDNTLVTQIVERFMEVASNYVDDEGITWEELEMSIKAVHLNGCLLDLDKLLAFDDFNLLHDVVGMNNNVCRDTGKLLNFFLPKCSK